MELLFPIIFLMAGILTTFTLIKTNWCDVQAKYCDGKEHVACEPNSLTTNEFCSNITYIHSIGRLIKKFDSRPAQPIPQ